jgi:hypothetical protein
MADLEAIESLTRYVRDVAQVMDADLSDAMQPSAACGIRPRGASVQLASARHRATMFERAHQPEPAPAAAPTPVCAATQTRNGRVYGGERIR